MDTAARLRVSTATVYGLCERGRLPYVRVSTHAIRIGEPDLWAFLRGSHSGKTSPPAGGTGPLSWLAWLGAPAV